jgi:Tfp pilus assembly protein PilF
MMGEAIMSFFQTSILTMTIIFIFAGCASNPKQGDSDVLEKSAVSDQTKVPDSRITLIPKKDLNQGEQQLSVGISYYEDGKYALAEKSLKKAQDLGLSDIADQVTAHKYLAFLYCTSNRKTLCKKEFNYAFKLDPDFTLSPAEEGHPMWRNIYHQVKDQMNPAKKKQ